MPPFAYNGGLPPGPLSNPAPPMSTTAGPPFGIPPAPSFDAADYYAKQPYMLQYNLAVDQQLTPGMAITVAYVGTRGVHLFALSEANPCTPTGFDANGLPNWVTSAAPPIQ
jgi:hypothetical protein